ncbi:MAG: hypothetical protein KAR37_05975 [Alphaproteobacteria bacterium]|nr:hypothetical protein [Alphaproteobacteria bacterium]
MIPLTAKITGMVVTLSMGLFLSAVAVLCVLPVMQAIMERRRPEMPSLPPIMENLGIAMAFAGLTFRVTEFTAIGVGLALLGAWYGYSKGASRKIHPIFDKVSAVSGVICVGVLAEYYYVLS